MFIEFLLFIHILLTYGGESGIRTHGTTVSGTLDFESSAFDQLSHLSAPPDYVYIFQDA